MKEYLGVGFGIGCFAGNCFVGSARANVHGIHQGGDVELLSRNPEAVR
jgi:hypothetical protein